MPTAVPDLRASLKTADAGELAELLEAFDVSAVYDKIGRTLELGATVMPELVPDNKTPPTERRPVGDTSIAGAGFEPATSVEIDFGRSARCPRALARDLRCSEVW
jgi:hypothetical protein